MTARKFLVPFLAAALFLSLRLDAAHPTPSARGDRGLSPEERLQRLMPAYERLKSDPALKSLDPGRLGRKASPAEFDAYLKALPLSPLEALKIDMRVRHYEVMIPKLSEELHRRWIRLHAKEARDLYGDVVVDATLYATEPPPTAEEVAGVLPPTLLKALPGNHNLASTSNPAPEDYQGEVQIAANPSNVNQIVAAANTFDAPFASCGDSTIAVYYSADAGVTWGYTCAPDNTAYPALPACTDFVFASDPALAWNANGEAFLNYMLLCTANGIDLRFAMVVARSIDGGATWTGQGVVKNSWPTLNVVEDKNFYTVDRSATSPYFGRHYTCWDSAHNEKLAYSANNGVSWTEVDLPSPGIGTIDVGCDVAVDRSGKVHVIFNNHVCIAGPCTNSRLYYTNSGDGGTTWSALRQLRDYNLTEFTAAACPAAQDDRCVFTMGAIDVDRSGGSCDGSVYVTYGDYEAGRSVEDMDIWVQRGINGGGIWLPAVKVNNDFNPDINHIQFHPSLAVDQYDGELAVAWYDGRNHASNKLIDVYFGTSKDCGGSFSNVQLTANSSEFNNAARSTSNENTLDNVPGDRNQYGEYLGVDVQSSKLSVAWVDSRHFYPAFPTESQKENIAFEQRALAKVAPMVTYKSIAAEDGWVQESSETSNVGDFSSTTDIVAGDNNLDEQRKGILSFDTSNIPDAATIQFARLKIRRKSLTGASPYTLTSLLTADIKNGTFGLPGLQASDFEASPSAVSICFPPEPTVDGAWTECNVLAAGIAQINKTGKTQFKVHFMADDNDNLAYDSMAFYSGEAADADRPQLIVTYY